MRAALAAAAAAVAVLSAPAAALASGGPVPPVSATPTPTPTATPTPSPAPAALTLRATGTQADQGRQVAVAGTPFTVQGKLSPAVKGQRVRLTVMHAGRLVGHTRRTVARDGSFSLVQRRWKPGTYTVRAEHRRSARLAGAHSNRVRVVVVGSSIVAGRGGAAVRLLQRGLDRLHYPAPRSGVYDGATERAVMAFRKVTGRARVFSAGRDVLLGVLAGQGAWRVRHPHDGRHVEADISLQVLVLVNGSHVVRIQYMSSGKPSTPTVLGRYRVYRKSWGTNSEGMVDSSYFIRGYAIHGYASVPTYNASHGCLRVPIPDAATIFGWLRVGDVVWVQP
jgi:hypothetical protein